MSGTGFRGLAVWQKAKGLAVAVYRCTETGRVAKDFGLRDQLRRSAVSICSNIAEGDERGSAKEAVRFLYIAKGSAAELQTQIEIAAELAYLDPDVAADLLSRAAEIARMLGALIRRRGSSP
ncbi:MAG: four helix bundle protein [Betaproteobacteria bacterium]|nr:four helix bundle protein [Betaproteobacteria bacterium]